ncbi:probable RNA polymerase II nuclear localization protein SLC7A6OS [Nasonia vitripennis]|uniref:Probable RNA polymerase II nuclear localization protein SLC7A6OS n=1 Tax=Nasonia vitripennis TaxID=7425 RepID=A0A7M7LJJ7_NASVI|nr:probable RNA polymerase II nuclear localization protein SLC7A6OS [Nasonia vitripennis]
MAAILRVKRKKDHEPLDALLISCKRQKVECEEDSASAPLTAIVKFAGTVEKQDDCVIEHITKTFSKDVLKSNYKQHIVDITKKAREKTKQESNENRYKIINSIRSLDTSLLKELDEDNVNIIDIEDTKAAADQKTDIDYVYDLYYTQTKEAIQLENLLSVVPIEEDLVFEDYYKDNDYQGESEDSNSESNWRNDYPDSDHSENSIGENDIRNAMKNLTVADESSSDEDFVYGLNEEDVERYGWKYAHYKARIKKEMEDDDKSNGDYHSDMDDFSSSDASSDCSVNGIDE